MVATVKLSKFEIITSRKFSRYQSEVVNRRSKDNTVGNIKKSKEQTLIYKTLHRKQNIEQHEPNKNRG